MRTNRYARVALMSMVLLAPTTTLAATFYVSPKGSDSAAGTESAPFASVGRAQTAAAAGDTVYIRGGTYAFTGTGTLGVSFTKSGQANALIKYFAYQGETPVFDLSTLTPSNRVTGLDVHCSFVHLRGLSVTGVRQYQSGSDSWGVRVQGSNNVLENLNVHHNQAPGIFITSGANNQVINCDSHHNYDQLEGGGSGDGFGCHSTGSNNLMSGCRAYDNSDDGFDFINAAGTCIVEKSFSFRNGWIPDTKTGAGNGAGFKAGGYGSPPETPSTGAAVHTVRQCVAFGNRSQGFYANHHPGRINFFNNTAFNNPVNYNMLADSGYPSSHVIRNNVAMSTGTAISNLSGGTATNNSWNLSVTVSSADFVSVTLADAEAARQSGGNLPDNTFLRLASSSDLIDQGLDVGLPFSGRAPDLGANEAGLSTSGGSASGGNGSGGTATGGTSAIVVANGGVATANGGSKAAGGSKASGGSKAINATGGLGGSISDATSITGTLGTGGRRSGSGGSGGAPRNTGTGGSLSFNSGSASSNPSQSAGGNTDASSGNEGAAPADDPALGGAINVSSSRATGTRTSAGGSSVGNRSETTRRADVSPGGNSALDSGAAEVATGSANEPAGCSCRVARRTTSRLPGALFVVALLSLRRRQKEHGLVR